VLSHHMVIREGKIANYHPYPPTPWNANPRDIYGTPGPYEDAVQNTPIFEENGPDNFKGIDIMRAVRSFDPCLPCGVHMYINQEICKMAIQQPTPDSHPTRPAHTKAKSGLRLTPSKAVPERPLPPAVPLASTHRKRGPIDPRMPHLPPA
jgi:hypothetical protein